MSTADVDSIGQGRVWSGTDAKRIGLIDEFGGLTDAIREAARLAKVKDYSITNLPAQKDPFTRIMETLSGDNSFVWVKKQLGSAYPYYSYLMNMSRLQGVQALMPFEIIVE
jgi:protease-4